MINPSLPPDVTSDGAKEYLRAILQMAGVALNHIDGESLILAAKATANFLDDHSSKTLSPKELRLLVQEAFGSFGENLIRDINQSRKKKEANP